MSLKMTNSTKKTPEAPHKANDQGELVAAYPEKPLDCSPGSPTSSVISTVKSSSQLDEVIYVSSARAGILLFCPSSLVYETSYTSTTEFFLCRSILTGAIHATLSIFRNEKNGLSPSQLVSSRRLYLLPQRPTAWAFLP